MKEKNSKLIFWAIRLTGILLLLFVIAQFCVPWLSFFNQKSLNFGASEDKIERYKVEYLNLFTPNEKKRLNPIRQKLSENQHAFITYSYNKTYNVLIHKVNLFGKDTLGSYVTLDNNKSIETPYIIYEGSEVNSFYFKHSNEHDSLVKNIYINYDDKLLEERQVNDSILFYNFRMTTLSVRYEKAGINDFLFINKVSNVYEKTPVKISINMVLLRKKDSVYFIFIYPKEKGRFMDSNIILDALGIIKIE